MSAPYLFSRYACTSSFVSVTLGITDICHRAIDPIFAMGIGITAAAVRINREEKEKGHSTQQTLDRLKRRTSMLFEKGNDVKAASSKVG